MRDLPRSPSVSENRRDETSASRRVVHPVLRYDAVLWRACWLLLCVRANNESICQNTAGALDTRCMAVPSTVSASAKPDGPARFPNTKAAQQEKLELSQTAQEGTSSSKLQARAVFIYGCFASVSDWRLHRLL